MATSFGLPHKDHVGLFPEGLESSPDGYFDMLLKPLFRRKLAMMMRLLPGKLDGGRILEVGYGCGIALKELSHRFGKVIAIDVHQHGSSVERMMECEAIENVDLYRHDIFREPMQNGGPFDYVFSSSVMEHIGAEGLRFGMKNIHGIVKKCGYLLAGFPMKTPLTDFLFSVDENTYMKLMERVRPVSDFSHKKKSHPSSHEDIIEAMDGYFSIEEIACLQKTIKLYMVVKCRRID